MTSRKIKRYHQFNKALQPLIIHWHWSKEISPEINEFANKDLREFLKKAWSLMPRTVIYPYNPIAIDQGGTEYLRRLMSVKNALEKKRWDLACHELQDMLHFDQIEDRRILYSIIGLLEEYL